tara:strand:- start:156967 stop:157692 length:726 start_codon:yes stop_codon:yes gene_type:complete
MIYQYNYSIVDYSFSHNETVTFTADNFISMRNKFNETIIKEEKIDLSMLIENSGGELLSRKACFVELEQGCDGKLMIVSYEKRDSEYLLVTISNGDDMNTHMEEYVYKMTKEVSFEKVLSLFEVFNEDLIETKEELRKFENNYYKNSRFGDREVHKKVMSSMKSLKGKQLKDPESYLKMVREKAEEKQRAERKKEQDYLVSLRVKLKGMQEKTVDNVLNRYLKSVNLYKMEAYYGEMEMTI